LVPVVFEVVVAPVQCPQTGGPGVVQARDREAGPVGSEVLAPRRPAFANGQMPWGDVAFDADLAAEGLGYLVRAPPLDAGDVKPRKPAVGHVAMIAARNRIGYADASCAVARAQAESDPIRLSELLVRRACYGEDGPRHKLWIVEHGHVADAGQDGEGRAG
jgi:hypothetical protein